MTIHSLGHTRHFALLTALLVSLGLTSSSAETPGHQIYPMLTDTPAHLRVIVTSAPYSPLLRVRYENQPGGPVQIQLRDHQGAFLYEQPGRALKGVTTLDLSQLPEGDYTVLVQTPLAYYQESIRVTLLGGRYPVVIKEAQSTTNHDERP